MKVLYSTLAFGVGDEGETNAIMGHPTWLQKDHDHKTKYLELQDAT